MRVSVLIVNWNGLEVLRPCLQAVAAQTHPAHEVIVVDNGSEDGSAEFLRTLDMASLKTLFLDRNLGFAAGNNAGYPLVTGEVVALLNNDAVPNPDWIAAVLPHFRESGVGMAACKILRFADPGTIDKAGHVIYADGLNRGRGTGQPDGPRFATTGDVLWPDGCAAFWRKSVLEDIGFFDEDYFLYGEDTDLGLRARWAGYRCVYEPRSVVLHHHSSTLGKFGPKKIYYVERNRIWILVKHFPLSLVLLSPWSTGKRFFMNLMSIVLRRGSAAGFTKEHSPWRLLRVLIHATWDGLCGTPRMMVKRKRTRRRLTSKQMKMLLKKHRISAREIALCD